MNIKTITTLGCLFAALITPVNAGGRSGGHHKSTYAVGVKRDASGAIARSSTARHDFMKLTGYPNGRPGYVIDHVIALKRGGADHPSNMQWQTIAEAKAKDRTE